MIKMSKISVDLVPGVVGNWKQTYKWIPIFGALVAFALAFSTGANNLPIPFSSPVGSGALKFYNAAMLACIIYVPGAAFAGDSTINALFSDFIRERQPDAGFLMWSMVVVLITATLWLAIATYIELPVSTQQSMQAALLGTIFVTDDFSFFPLRNKNENHNFNSRGLALMLLEWSIAPTLACACAFFFFLMLKTYVARQETTENRILIFLPIYYGVAAGLLCLFTMSQVVSKYVTPKTWVIFLATASATFIGALSSFLVVVPLARAGVHNEPGSKNPEKEQSIEGQDQQLDAKVDEKVEEMLRDFVQMRVLDTVYEEDEISLSSPPATASAHIGNDQSNSQRFTGQSAPFKQLLESTPNKLIPLRNCQKIEQTTNRANAHKLIKDFAKAKLFHDIEYDRKTLIRHALAEKFDDMEDYFTFPILLASSILALIQSATEFADLLGPFGAIFNIFSHRSRFYGEGEDLGSLDVQWWIRALGGLCASMGFFLYGWPITQCLGSRLTYQSNSRGVVSQLSAVMAVIIVNIAKLPVSNVHAFIGALVGLGIADEPRNVNWKLLVKFLLGWILTIIFCCSVSYLIYSGSLHSPAYVVP